MGVVEPKESLLQDDGLGLKLDCLQEVSELELDTRNFGDTVCHLLVHGT